MSNTNAILFTTNLSIGYKTKAGTTNPAKNLNLNLQSGKLIALIGFNGIENQHYYALVTGIQEPLEELCFEKQKLVDYQPLSLAQNLSIVLTEKLPRVI
jgi:iron complex transport system ATP-binding protein